VSRTSTRKVRSASRASAARSAARRRSRKPKPRRGWLRRRGGGRGRKRGGRRRFVWLGLAVVVGLALGYGVANRDELEETIREVTLPLRHEDVIRQEADDHDVPADLIAAVIYAESRFRDQTSSAGARGLMQITPATAEIIAELSQGTAFEQSDLADPDVNIAYGSFYLRHLLDKFEGNEVAALAAYNAGETNVAAWGGPDLGLDDIRFPETREYVEDVQDKREDYRSHYGDELGLD
jgi:soluble lytic murein transglycosylase